MKEAFIALVGVLIGIAVTEYLRRRSRIEVYSSPVFEKRLQIYEELYAKVNHLRGLFHEIINSDQLSKEERKELWERSVFSMAVYLDENDLYLDEEIAVHAMMTMVGVEDIQDIQDIQDEKEKNEAVQSFQRSVKELVSLIREEAGIVAIHRLFRRVTRSKPKSDYIDYF